jgi:hypothetical protein
MNDKDFEIDNSQPCEASRAIETMLEQTGVASLFEPSIGECLLHGTGVVHVQFADGQVLEYEHLALRDICEGLRPAAPRTTNDENGGQHEHPQT